MNKTAGKPIIRAIITDLDDTLWSWVDLWYHPFKAMLDVLVAKSGVAEEVLLQDIKKVFTTHGTTEYSFLIQEIECLKKQHPGENLKSVYEDALIAFREKREKHLQLYPEVYDVLKKLKQKGVLLIAYTESRSFYTKYRFRKFNLDLIFDYLYCAEDHDLPDDFSREKASYYDRHYKCRLSVEETIPFQVQKPSPSVLLGIMKDLAINKNEVLYIGDKLHKDIQMAKEASVIDVWAKYGSPSDRVEYELLRKVTHWKDEDVEKEKKTVSSDVLPSYTLQDNFGQLFDHFDFTSFCSSNHCEVIDIWKKTLDTQTHFNNIEIKIRGLVITILLATFAAAGMAIRYNVLMSFSNVEVPLASCLFFASAIGVSLLWMMDFLWYHKLLYGAVVHALKIEKRYAKIIPELFLSHEIKKSSSGVKLFGCIPFSSNTRLCVFYCVIILALTASGFLTARAQECKPTPSLELPVLLDIQNINEANQQEPNVLLNQPQ